jgi:hypothetical protein
MVFSVPPRKCWDSTSDCFLPYPIRFIIIINHPTIQLYSLSNWQGC